MCIRKSHQLSLVVSIANSLILRVVATAGFGVGVYSIHLLEQTLDIACVSFTWLAQVTRIHVSLNFQLESLKGETGRPLSETVFHQNQCVKLKLAAS